MLFSTRCALAWHGSHKLVCYPRDCAFVSFFVSGVSPLCLYVFSMWCLLCTQQTLLIVMFVFSSVTSNGTSHSDNITPSISNFSFLAFIPFKSKLAVYLYLCGRLYLIYLFTYLDVSKLYLKYVMTKSTSIQNNIMKYTPVYINRVVYIIFC